MGTKLAFAIAGSGQFCLELLDLGDDGDGLLGVLCEGKEASVLGLEFSNAAGDVVSF